MSGDYYELLGVSRDADASEIKRAFRRRARELHPDVNPDDPQAEERFREVTAAYEVLSDQERRSVYDRYGEAGLKQRHWEPQFASFGNIADIFSAFFGEDVFGAGMGGRRAGGATRGENVLVHVDLDFREAALGAQKTVEYDLVATCSQCDGRGAPEGGLEECPQCSGQGAVRTVTRSLFGQVIQETACPRCVGRGEIIVTPCPKCQGTGEQPEHRKVTVDIPAGIADGQRIRLTGRGSAGSGGGPAGNLYIDVSVQPDERFIREADDIITAADLTFAEAALGVTRPVDTVDGEPVNVEFRPGIQPGDIVTIEGRGVGRLRGGDGRGNQRIVVNVQVPRDLTGEQRELLERFRALETERNYASAEGLFDKLRRVLRA